MERQLIYNVYVLCPPDAGTIASPKRQDDVEEKKSGQYRSTAVEGVGFQGRQASSQKC